MASNNLAKSLKRSALTAAIGLCFVGGVHAQSTVGSISGNANAGDTITINNSATGLSRSITAGADGSYRFSSLPTGNYTVTDNGGDPREVRVAVGTASSVNFGGGTLGTVTVVGSNAVNPIDVSSVESTTILTAEQIKKIPVAQDTTSVALLAPGTVRGDSAFGNLASFGGASVAENQYYVNGFNVTNTFRNLNFAQIPFEAVGEQQIKTGGYGAEFGRSLGGVVNQVTKRGGNEFHAGGNIYYTPDSLRGNNKNRYYSNPLTTEFGEQFDDNSHDSTSTTTANVWASGALVKDRLFFYGLLSYGKTDADTFGSLLGTNNNTTETKRPKWLVKLDWNITDNNILEFTGFSDKTKFYTDSYSNLQGSFDRVDYLGRTETINGGENYILKYTGYLTDSFTLSALYGHSDFSRAVRLIGPDGTVATYDGNFNGPQQGCPVVNDARPGYRQAITGPYQSTCNISGGTIDRSDAGDTRDQYRIDAEWAIGDHLIRGGVDIDNYESIGGVALEGGSSWTYLTSLGPDRTPNTGDEFDVARQQFFSQGSTVAVDQTAYYIEDTWQITDNFIFYGGLRWDTFENYNGDGKAYVKIDNQLGPRLGFSWDVFGDSSFKVYGNAGRYALPLTPSVAVRGSSASLFSRETFTFSTVDPKTGVPTDPVSRGDQRFLNGEDGNPKDPNTIASKNLQPQYQDEYILGFQKQITDNVSVGVRGIYRDLKTGIDDNCDYTAVLVANGIDLDTFQGPDGRTVALPSSGFPYCRLFNPGADAVFETDLYNDGNYTTVTVPGETLSPQSKRTYTALEFFADGRWDNFFFQGSYTYAASKGNYEGGVKSDIGQGDTNVTQDFDYLALTVDTFGYLPNDRRHTFKLYGSYDITDQWTAGANLLIQSGRPRNCLGDLDLNPLRPTFDVNGNVVNDNFQPHPYGSSFQRCSSSVAGASDDDNVQTLPRGTVGRTPWSTNLDLNVAYKPNWAEGLKLQIDVFNVLNSQKVTSVNEQAENATTGAPVSSYQLPASFQARRSVRFLVQYDF